MQPAKQQSNVQAGAARTPDSVSDQELALMRAVCALQPRRVDSEAVGFPSLPASAEPVDGTPVQPLNVCIVTQDIVGPVRNGGIGTAYRYVAELLSRAGHKVTILYALGTYTENGPIEKWIAEYARLGIAFVPLPAPAVPNLKGNIGRAMARAYDIHEWLKTHDFDLVHVSEWRGLAYYCLVAKHLGLAFRDCLFCVKASSPTLWNLRGNDQLVEDPDVLIIAYMERKSVELADVLVSGSAYMLRWMLQQGYRLPPGRSHVQPNVMLNTAAAPVDTGVRSIDEIVFFGRLEPRKGLHLFCDAVTRLDTGSLPPFSVTFLGKHASKYDSHRVITQSAKGWPFPWRVIDGLDQPGALNYLSRPGRLAVMPSIMDNSPFGVYECLSHGIPFIASDIGGGPELIEATDRPAVLFPLQPTALAGRLSEILTNGARLASPGYDFADNNRVWVNWHNGLAAGGLQQTLAAARGGAAPAADPDEGPLVSVCIPHHNRPRYLAQALASVEAQTYKNFEVIVVDDGSTTAAAHAFLDQLAPRFAARGWTLVRQENLYLAAARNAAARTAKGRYLYFLDDDNCAKPETLSVLVAVAERTGADILTCFADLFSGDGAPDAATVPDARLTLIGDNVAYGAIANGFGDAHALVRKDTFDALGGYREEYGVGKEDMEFFARAVVHGCTLYHVPEALYWYRRSRVRLRDRHYRRHSGDYRVMQVYLDAAPHCFHPLMLLAQGQVHVHSMARRFANLIPGSALSEDMLAEKPRLYRLAHRVLRLELALWERFLGWQVRVGGRLLRWLSSLVKR